MVMKRSKLMRAASLAMVLCLATSCVVGGTLAKYTTQDSASDVARVAKWGVDLQIVGNLYGDTYKESIVLDNDKTLTVQSKDKAADVVAPGTKNDDGFTFRINGTPETNYQVLSKIVAQNVFLKKGTYGMMVPVASGVVTKANFDEFAENKSEGDCATGLWQKDGSDFIEATAFTAGTQYFTLEDYVAVSDDYFPVVYALSGSGVSGEESVYAGDNSKDTINLIAEKLAKQLKGAEIEASEKVVDAASNITTYTLSSIIFDANTDIAKNLALSNEKITWAWAFDENAATYGNADEEDCKADTILGLLMNRGDTDGENLSSDCTVVKLSSSKYVAPVEHTDFCLDTQFAIDITVNQSAEPATVAGLSSASSVAGSSEGHTVINGTKTMAEGSSLKVFLAANKAALPQVKYGVAVDLTNAKEPGDLEVGGNTVYEIVEIENATGFPVAFSIGNIVANVAP